jgi:hypothetical protein
MDLNGEKTTALVTEDALKTVRGGAPMISIPAPLDGGG